MSFTNPIIPQRADPWVYRHSDGQYYFTASVPEYDRIELRRAKTIQGLGECQTQTIWRKHDTGEMSWHIWAPEIHFIDGHWFIYFAAGKAEAIWDIRIWALRNDSPDPFAGMWIECGQVTTNFESFALDATTFEHRGTRYLAFAQHDPAFDTGTCLYLAAMSDPLTIRGKQIAISRPQLPWERIGHNVNEGPSILKRYGRIFCTYSAAATDHNYCMGLLSAPEDAELLDASSWTKSPAPVFKTCERTSQYGPGHNSFTIAEDGRADVLIYHARNYRDAKPDPLRDPNRHTRAQVFGWKPDGMPDFGEPL
jgi:GH43 family beta-xylosidase